MINFICLSSTSTGRGIYASADLKNGSFIVEYHGELLSAVEGNKREKMTGDKSVYRFFLKWHEKGYWYGFNHSFM